MTPLELSTRALKCANRFTRRHEIAEEIAQDAVIRLLLKGKGQTVNQAVIDSFRALFGKSSQKSNSLRSRIQVASDSEFPVAYSESFFIQYELQEALGKVDQKIRNLLVLSLKEGYTAEELGKMMGVNPSFVNAWIFNGVRELQEYLR